MMKSRFVGLMLMIGIFSFSTVVFAQKKSTPASQAGDAKAATKKSVKDNAAPSQAKYIPPSNEKQSLQNARNELGSAVGMLKREQDFVNDSGANYQRTLGYAEEAADVLICLVWYGQPCKVDASGGASKKPTNMKQVLAKLESSLRNLQKATPDQYGLHAKATDLLNRAISQAKNYLDTVPTGKPKGDAKGGNNARAESRRSTSNTKNSLKSTKNTNPTDKLADGDDPFGKNSTKKTKTPTKTETKIPQKP